MTKKTNVVVIGGGYAGVIAANHLRLNPDVAITLINPRPRVRRADPVAPARHRLRRRRRGLRRRARRRCPTAGRHAERIDAAAAP